MSKFNRMLLILAVFILLSCVRERFTILNPDFSVNLATPGSGWPGEQSLTEVEKAILKEYGRPNFFRIWWDEDGQLKSYLEVDRAIDKKEFRGVKKSWIYLERKVEIIFAGEKGYKVEPLSDKLEVLCRYGDPDERKISIEKEGEMKEEVWQYYSFGKLFKFYDGKLISEQSFPKLGKKIKT